MSAGPPPRPWLLQLLAAPPAALPRATPTDLATGARLPHPLVLLPGMLGDADVWAAVAPELAPRWDARIGRIDLDDTVPGCAESVLAAAPPRFVLAGHSLGGIVALEVARRAPDRVTHLALFNTSARDPSPEQLVGWTKLRGRVDAGGFAEVVDELVVELLPAPRRGEHALVDRGRRSAARVGPDGLRRQLAAQAARVDLRPSLSAIAVPTLVVSGALDHVCPSALQEEIVAGVPHAVHEVLADVGHMAPIEAPHVLAELLNRWER